MESIQAASPDSRGRLEFLALDLADLATVRRAAQTFLAASDRLDVLVQNAGIMHPPAGSKTSQGYELQLGVHCLGPVLLAELLAPLLAQTAAREQEAGRVKSSVRVVWASSLYSEMAPEGGFDPENMNYEKKDKDAYYKYSVSKAGVIYQGTEFAKRHRAEGIVSVVSGWPILTQTTEVLVIWRCKKLTWEALQPWEPQDRSSTAPFWLLEKGGRYDVVPRSLWRIHGVVCHSFSGSHS